MDNLEFFNYSIENEDDTREFVKPEGVIVVSREKKNKLMNDVEKLNNLITNYYELKQKGKKLDELNDTIDAITEIIEKSKQKINYTPFCKYFQVLRYSYSKVKSIYISMDQEEKREFTKYLLDEYIENRYEIYEHYEYTHSILQVMADDASSRRNGTIGLKMLKNILEPLKFVYVEKYEDFEKQDYCFINTDKKGKKLLDQFLKEERVKFKFKQERDNKYPDMLIKIKQQYFILEHKLTNGGGGSQNAEINEIINFIRYDEKKEKKIHYVSCLQGDFFKSITPDSTQPKNVAQRENILNALKEHPNNFFVNGKALEKLIEEYKKV